MDRRWALCEPLEAIPQYYLTGYRARRSGTGWSCSSAAVVLAGLVYGLWRALTPARGARGAARADASAARAGWLIPLALAVLGADYLAPRNLVAAMVPVSALLAS